MTILQDTWLSELQQLVTNPLDPEALRGKRVAAILGDVPSIYAKSPKLWNAAFRALDVPAGYVSFDIPEGRLGDVIQVLRGADTFLGGSVTVPYKVAVIPLLDGVDPIAGRIGAVNVIVRTADGRLIGYNTDGLGGLRALTAPILPGPRPKVPALVDARVLLIGAGGAAQAVAFYCWEQMVRGDLTIANRTRTGAEALVKRLGAMRAGRLSAVSEASLVEVVLRADLIINATTKGQAGIRKLSDGRWTCLEPYSTLAPVEPVALPVAPGREGGFWSAWYERAQPGIVENQQRSLELCTSVPKHAVCYDIIYAPLETTFLRHARWSGHGTLNGREMNVIQAVEAFMRFVCRDWLVQCGLEPSAVYPRVVQAMAEEWAK